MNWWDIAKFVIGGTIGAVITAVVSRGLFLPTLRVPKNSLWQRLRLRLGWRWDYLLQTLDMTATHGSRQWRQLEVRLPVINNGGRAAEGCTVDLQVIRVLPGQFVRPLADASSSSAGPLSGFDSIFHNPRWVVKTDQGPQVGAEQSEIAPGSTAWFSFMRMYIASGQPAADFNCPGEFLTSASSMALRLQEGSKPVSGLFTVYSKNAMPTRCYFSLKNKNKKIVLSLKRMFALSLGAVGIWFPVPFLAVTYTFEVSTLTELPGEGPLI